ncbi:probable apyrase 6 isoform X1 [Olea europaea subsp. europaea]|uniref:Probable apyrase 6 isoform X1 n=1 Tax=Olea europaea subsp. europaea TaxID=158383 RepID=A0A8S0QMI1_OLEEU|nr:probable apyrase 6 isoform X1 [Olea europaea subsp. europaea]
MRRSNARKVRPRLENQMDHIKLQYRSARPVFRNPNSKNAKHRSRILLYTSILLALVLFCYILIFWNRDEQRKRYGVVIDGGSTGTRIHVFKYEVRNGNSVLDFTEKGLKTMKVSPGLSAHIEEPERAGAAVAELVEFARRNVPKEYWGKTEIRLMATAGMRLLKERDQERILAVCRKVLRGSGFRFLDNWATVISGSDEGLYAWVVANYALGTLGGDPAHTTGIIELGGASAQVIFVSDEPMPPEYSRKVKFGNFTYNLYSHSLLQYGQNVALELLRELLVSGSQEEATESEGRKLVDPCTPRGYTRDQETQKLSPVSLIEKNRYPSTFHPYGNFSECRSASLKLLRKGKDRCSYQRCYIGSTFIPKLQGKFLATENFFYTSKFFELTPRGFLSKLMVAGQQFCEGDWTELKRKYHSLDEEELLRYCFSSAYIVALLHDSLGIALDDDRIGYANQVQNIPLDWALGAFILHSAIDSDVQHSNWIMIVISGDSSTLLLLLGFSLVSIAAWIVFKWRKPKQKTIYDLEKGKYIVKRGSRYS